MMRFRRWFMGEEELPDWVFVMPVMVMVAVMAFLALFVWK